VVLLTLESDEDEVDVLSGVMRRLDEKTVKESGYKWRFHKSDADPFPSPLHGHDYERGLKIDALERFRFELNRTVGVHAVQAS
jgi:hypothetical protein